MSQEASANHRQFSAGLLVSSSAPRNPYPQQQQVNSGSESNREVQAEGPAAGDPALIESPITPEVGGVYAPLMRRQYERETENASTIPLGRRVIGGLRDQVEKSASCRCQKGCLKLYCECFAGGIYCGAYCNCQGCSNDGSIEHQDERNRAILACIERNPHSFRSNMNVKRPVPILVERREVPSVPAVASRPVASRPTTSRPTASRSSTKKNENPCNCTKSRCLKKYCDCFRRDEYCSANCKCHSCMNEPGNTTREQLAAAARKKMPRSGATTARGESTKATSSSSHGGARRQIAGLSGPDPTADSTWVRNDSYPPSYYAVPMSLPPNGVSSATLGFGQGSTLKKRKAEVSVGDAPGAFERAMATEEAVLARRKAEVDAKTNGGSTPTQAGQDAPTSVESILKQHWNEETRDVLGTFQAMRQELLQRKQDAGLLGVDIVLTREYSYYDLVGSAQLASVELELADVLESVREAGDRAKEAVAKEDVAKETNSATAIEHAAQGHPKARKLSQSQRAAVITEAAQDTALMRELARIIRRRALEMWEGLY